MPQKEFGVAPPAAKEPASAATSGTPGHSAALDDHIHRGVTRAKVQAVHRIYFR